MNTRRHIATRAMHVGIAIAVLAASIWGGTPTPAPTATPVPLPPEAARLLGCWQGRKDPAVFIRFEPTRCIMNEHGQIACSRAKYFSDRVLLTRLFHQSALGTSVDADHELTVEVNKKTRVYVKLATTPPELELLPLKLGEAKPVDAATKQKIQQELARRTGALVHAAPVKGTPAATQPAISRADYMRTIMTEYGWIDVPRFGQKASSDAATLLKDCADTSLMLTAIEAMEKDITAKRGDAGAYARLYDRTQLMLGYRQKYGTQISQNDKGEVIVLPLEDRAQVEACRKQIGIPTLAEFLEFFKQQTGATVVKYQED